MVKRKGRKKMKGRSAGFGFDEEEREKIERGRKD